MIFPKASLQSGFTILVSKNHFLTYHNFNVNFRLKIHIVVHINRSFLSMSESDSATFPTLSQESILLRDDNVIAMETAVVDVPTTSDGGVKTKPRFRFTRKERREYKRAQKSASVEGRPNSVSQGLVRANNAKGTTKSRGNSQVLVKDSDNPRQNSTVKGVEGTRAQYGNQGAMSVSNKRRLSPGGTPEEYRSVAKVTKTKVMSYSDVTAVCDLRTAIVPVGLDPQVSAEEADVISAMLTSAVEKSIDSNGTPLRFPTGSGCVRGVFVANCGDIGTKNWLVEVVRGMKLGLTELQAIDFSKISKPIKFSVNFRGASSVTTTIILARLGIQNPGLNTSRWRIYSRVNHSWGIHLVVAVDKGTADFLRENSFTLCYLLGRVSFLPGGRMRAGDIQKSQGPSKPQIDSVKVGGVQQRLNYSAEQDDLYKAPDSQQQSGAQTDLVKVGEVLERSNFGMEKDCLVKVPVSIPVDSGSNQGPIVGALESIDISDDDMGLFSSPLNGSVISELEVMVTPVTNQKDDLVKAPITRKLD